MVVAKSQTRGRGQRGKYWRSNAGENLLATLFYRPKDMLVNDVFFISVVSALAAVKLLNLFDIDGRIKWPNDILVNGKKIAGILIENQVSRGLVDTAMVGIGLNINQRSFEEFPWPATSMCLECEHDDLDPIDLANTYRMMVRELSGDLGVNNDALIQMYNSKLHNRTKEVTLKQGREIFKGNLVAVNRSGQLLIEKDLQLMAFHRGEIQLANLD